MDALGKNKERKARAKNRVRKKILQERKRPRLSIFRGNKNLYAQVIDDRKGITLAAAATNEQGFAGEGNRSNIEYAKKLGNMIAERAKAKDVTEVVFDRGGYPYHGKIKAFAEAAREGGLKL
jgi:large subunit ribosomal protein L18